MRKRSKKSPPNKVVKKPTCPSFTHNEADLWREITDATQRKFCTVVPQHNALQPASPAFLQNYSEIFGHD